MNKIEYRLYKTDKNSYIPLLIEEVYLSDGSHYFIYTRLGFIWKKTLTRGIVRYLLGLDQDPNTNRNNFIISRTAYESDYFFYNWLFKHAINEIRLIRSEEIYIYNKIVIYFLIYMIKLILMVVLFKWRFSYGQ